MQKCIYLVDFQNFNWILFPFFNTLSTHDCTAAFEHCRKSDMLEHPYKWFGFIK